MKEMDLVARVKDFEESQLDLDDVSFHKTYHNLFTAEIRAIINKKNEMNKEINKLLGRSSWFNFILLFIFFINFQI